MRRPVGQGGKARFDALSANAQRTLGRKDVVVGWKKAANVGGYDWP